MHRIAQVVSYHFARASCSITRIQTSNSKSWTFHQDVPLFLPLKGRWQSVGVAVWVISLCSKEHFLVGGSPCKSDNQRNDTHGLGWQLWCCGVRMAKLKQPIRGMGVAKAKGLVQADSYGWTPTMKKRLFGVHKGWGSLLSARNLSPHTFISTTHLVQFHSKLSQLKLIRVDRSAMLSYLFHLCLLQLWNTTWNSTFSLSSRRLGSWRLYCALFDKVIILILLIIFRY